jgi:sulfur carrier protein ThiS
MTAWLYGWTPSALARLSDKKVMFVKVKLYGTLRRLSNPQTPGLWQGEIPDGTSLRQLVELLGTHEEEVAAAALDDRVCPLETIIPPGATVVFVTPVGGG